MSGPSLPNLNLFGEEILEPSRGKIADRFLIPPFTILNAREGWWQDRKREWLRLGIQSEVGRQENLLELSVATEPTFYPQKKAWEEANGEAISTGDFARDHYERPEGAGEGSTSIFDPVLCELAYRWFCPAGGLILDPFAGGSVRGILASKLGRQYIGIDLRSEQVEANRDQALTMLDEGETLPQWIIGDSGEELPKLVDLLADFLFTCPPYGDLEQYSSDRRDLSAMGHEKFLHAYRAIIRASCERLRWNRFAGIVVGDFRNGEGFYRNFVSETIRAFLDAGLTLYNEAILVTSVGSAAMRLEKQFEATRKMGKTHQNLLIFLKGDPIRAARAAKRPAP